MRTHSVPEMLEKDPPVRIEMPYRPSESNDLTWLSPHSLSLCCSLQLTAAASTLSASSSLNPQALQCVFQDLPPAGVRTPHLSISLETSLCCEPGSIQIMYADHTSLAVMLSLGKSRTVGKRHPPKAPIDCCMRTSLNSRQGPRVRQYAGHLFDILTFPKPLSKTTKLGLDPDKLSSSAVHCRGPPKAHLVATLF